MPECCAIYLPLDFLPTAERLGPLFPGATLQLDSQARQATILWPGRSLKLTRMPDERMPAHLDGFIGYLRANQGSEALVMRVLQSHAVLGVVGEPALDDEVRRCLGGLLAATEGLLFLAGELLDSDGRGLLRDAKGGLRPPEARRVADRALVLVALAARGLLEEDAGKPSEGKAESMRRELLARLDELLEGREEHEPEERELLQTPIGKAPRQPMVDAVWKAEAAQVLLWALGARTLSAHDLEVHPCALADEVGLRGGEAPAWLEAPRLRPAEALDRMRRTLTAIHWRLREQRDRPHPVDLVGFAQENWFGGCSLEGVALAGRDLAIEGTAVGAATGEQLSRVASIAEERHHAANWLVGVHPVYSRVQTPT